jgi:hypothetical protein
MLALWFNPTKSTVTLNRHARYVCLILGPVLSGRHCFALLRERCLALSNQMQMPRLRAAIPIVGTERWRSMVRRVPECQLHCLTHALNQLTLKHMKITNINSWLPSPYYVARYNGQQIGFYSTKEEAIEAYEAAKDKNWSTDMSLIGRPTFLGPCASIVTWQ